MTEFDFRTLPRHTEVVNGLGDIVRLVAVDAPGEYPIAGITRRTTQLPSGERSETVPDMAAYTKHGRYHGAGVRSPCDLVPPKQTVTYERWLVLEYDGGALYTSVCRSLEDARRRARTLPAGRKTRIIHLHGEADMDDNSVLEVLLP